MLRWRVFLFQLSDGNPGRAGCADVDKWLQYFLFVRGMWVCFCFCLRTRI